MRPRPCGWSRDQGCGAMFVDELRRAVEAASRSSMPAVTAALWKAFGAGQVTEAEAEEISALIEARRIVTAVPVQPAKRVGSRPRSQVSLERRRRLAASGAMPPALAARFTMAEAAVLAIVADQVDRHGRCTLTLDHIAALAGVGRTSVRNALREARLHGLIAVEERRLTAWRNDSNLIRIVSAEWRAWRARRGGRKFVRGTNTRDLERGRRQPAEAPQEASEERKAGPPAPQSELVRFAEAGSGGSRSYASWS